MHVEESTSYFSFITAFLPITVVLLIILLIGYVVYQLFKKK